MKFGHVLFMMMTMLMTLSALAQNEPDSLLKKLNAAPNDSVKARTLLDIGESIESRETEKSLIYYRQAFELAEKIHNNRLTLSSLGDLGIGNMESNHLDTAIAYFNQGLKFAGSLGDTNRIAVMHSNLGNAYRYKKDRINALDHFQQSIRLLEQKKDSLRLPSVYQNLSICLLENNEFRESILYAEKARSMATAQGDDYTAANALITMSDDWVNLGDSSKQFEMLQEAEVLAKRTEDLEENSTIYNNLGAWYTGKKNFQQALRAFSQSYRIASQMGNHFHLCEASTRMAEVFKQLNRPDSALFYVKKAESLATEIGSRSDLRAIYITRAEIEKQTGHPDAAYQFLSRAITLGDSLYKTSTSEKIAEMEARYETEKKQQQITALQKDREIDLLAIKQKELFNRLVTGLAVALLIVAFLIFGNLRRSRALAKQTDEIQRQRIVELEKNRQLLVADSLLQGQEEERGRLARDLHDGLGGLLSGVKFSMRHMKENLILKSEDLPLFERSLDLIDNSIAEMRRIAHNMMPEGLVTYGLDEALKQYCSSVNTNGMLQVRYQSVGLSDRLGDQVEITVYRVIQELVNNVLKHAEATEVSVQVIRGEGRLNISVEDNGKGFDPDSLRDKKGAGWINIQARVDYLKGQLELNSGEGKGTQVNIEFSI